MEIMHESIFTSSLRIFCRTLFAVFGIFLAVFIISLTHSALFPPSLVEEKTSLTVLPNAAGIREELPFSTPAILQIKLHGVIGMEGPNSINSQTIEDILLDSRVGPLGHDRVKGILLHINSPGGTVVDSDNIYRMLKAYKAKYNIPIFAYVDGLCASGGMYIACAADQIFASPPSLIGSVGVILGPMFNISETLKKVGVEALTLTQGLDKDALNPTRPWRPGEDASYKTITAFLYQQFVDIVTSSRHQIDKEKLIDEYGAHMFNCIDAQKFGYIDHGMSNRDAALEALLAAAQIDAAKPYQVVELRAERNWISQLIQGQSALLSGKIEHTLNLGQPKFRDSFSYLYLHE